MLDANVIAGVEGYGEGIFVGGGWSDVHEDPIVTITGNTIDNFDMGIDIYEFADVTITGNDITNNDYGIYTNAADAGEGWAQTVAAHCNNIVGNSDYGVYNSENSATIDATNNWWGDASGPAHSPGLGDNVSDNVDYEPWLMAPWPSAETEETATETFDGDGTMPDTPTGGNVTINATGNHTVTTAKYAENPGGESTFQATGDYWDVYLDNATNVTSVTIEFCPADPGDTIYYYDTTAGWKPCSDQVYADGCITVTITDATEPSLADLAGQEFARGRQGAPEQVPEYNIFGLAALIGILSVVLAVATLKRKRG